MKRRYSEVMWQFAAMLCPVGYQMDCVKIPFKSKKGTHHYTLDFANIEAKVDIEIDEKYHEKEEVRKKDARRDKHMRGLGWKVIRIKVRKADRIVLKTSANKS